MRKVFSDLALNLSAHKQIEEENFIQAKSYLKQFPIISNCLKDLDEQDQILEDIIGHFELCCFEEKEFIFKQQDFLEDNPFIYFIIYGKVGIFEQKPFLTIKIQQQQSSELLLLRNQLAKKGQHNSDPGTLKKLLMQILQLEKTLQINNSEALVALCQESLSLQDYFFSDWKLKLPKFSMKEEVCNGNTLAESDLLNKRRSQTCVVLSKVLGAIRISSSIFKEHLFLPSFKIHFVCDALKKHINFSDWTSSQLQTIAKKFSLETYSGVVQAKGQESKGIYIVLQGILSFTGLKSKEIKTRIEPGEVFGIEDIVNQYCLQNLIANENENAKVFFLPRKIILDDDQLIKTLQREVMIRQKSQLTSFINFKPSNVQNLINLQYPLEQFKPQSKLNSISQNASHSDIQSKIILDKQSQPYFENIQEQKYLLNILNHKKTIIPKHEIGYQRNQMATPLPLNSNNSARSMRPSYLQSFQLDSPKDTQLQLNFNLKRSSMISSPQSTTETHFSTSQQSIRAQDPKTSILYNQSLINLKESSFHVSSFDMNQNNSKQQQQSYSELNQVHSDTNLKKKKTLMLNLNQIQNPTFSSSQALFFNTQQNSSQQIGNIPEKNINRNNISRGGRHSMMNFNFQENNNMDGQQSSTRWSSLHSDRSSNTDERNNLLTYRSFKTKRRDDIQTPPIKNKVTITSFVKNKSQNDIGTQTSNPPIQNKNQNLNNFLVDLEFFKDKSPILEKKQNFFNQYHLGKQQLSQHQHYYQKQTQPINQINTKNQYFQQGKTANMIKSIQETPFTSNSSQQKREQSTQENENNKLCIALGQVPSQLLTRSSRQTMNYLKFKFPQQKSNQSPFGSQKNQKLRMTMNQLKDDSYFLQSLNYQEKQDNFSIITKKKEEDNNLSFQIQEMNSTNASEIGLQKKILFENEKLNKIIANK